MYCSLFILFVQTFFLQNCPTYMCYTVMHCWDVQLRWFKCCFMYLISALLRSPPECEVTPCSFSLSCLPPFSHSQPLDHVPGCSETRRIWVGKCSHVWQYIPSPPSSSLLFLNFFLLCRCPLMSIFLSLQSSLFFFFFPTPWGKSLFFQGESHI